MIEKVIYLEGVEPVDILGVNNSRFERIRTLFPRLKILSRGDELKVSGEESDIEEFENKIDLLVSYLHRYNKISSEDMDELFLSEEENPNKLKPEDKDVLLYGESGRPVRAQTTNQKLLVEESAKSDLLFAIGPAGTGKTYTAIALAVRSLKRQEVKRIILTRPAVEAGERLGFLPGDFKEKLDPYLQPLYDALNDMIPSRKLKTFMEEGTIQIAPLAYMRGRTLDNAFVILDEAQNATHNQLKMFLTRMGRNARFIVTGDITQIDLPKNQDSGLIMAEKILEGIRGISVIHFDQRDIVRHRLVKSIVDAYNKEDKKVKK
ncbi:MAG: PhoH family protein [Bacteroidales bacterium]|nr:PhoH family protein [Bacteroidales bacterium]MCB9012870.1 PhoH family protein [Bacteroidales bacterium]